MNNVANVPLSKIASSIGDLNFAFPYKQIVNLDLAATTPPFSTVKTTVDAAMELYGSVHRGTGFTSRISTCLLESARQRIFEFAGGRNDKDTIIFGQNSTECMNILARRMAQYYGTGFRALISGAEHTSNLLPWLRWASVRRCKLTLDGDWDIAYLENLLSNSDRPKIIAITAASNLTGRLTNVNDVAKLAHEYGIPIAVDASQFVAHRNLRQARIGNEYLWDFVVFAGHKMYAPYGTGVLLGPSTWFTTGWPDRPGGGTIRMIDDKDIAWESLPHREEGGTPNFSGIIALAAASEVLEDVGYDHIEVHEAALTEKAQTVFSSLEQIKIHRPLNHRDTRWLPVFPFTIHGYKHNEIGNYLGLEKGISVRTGHLCQHEFIRNILNVSSSEKDHLMRLAKQNDVKDMYGVVRASCGLTSTKSDIEDLSIALQDFLDNVPNTGSNLTHHPNSIHSLSDLPQKIKSKIPWLTDKNTFIK